MKPEPLKNKIKKWKLPKRWYAFEEVSITDWRLSEQEKCYFRYKDVHELLKQIKSDVKLAVKGLLKDIERYKRSRVDGDVCLPTDWVVQKIKKWFGDF